MAINIPIFLSNKAESPIAMSKRTDLAKWGFFKTSAKNKADRKTNKLTKTATNPFDIEVK